MNSRCSVCSYETKVVFPEVSYIYKYEIWPLLRVGRCIKQPVVMIFIETDVHELVEVVRVHLGPSISLGLTHWSNCSSVR